MGDLPTTTILFNLDASAVVAASLAVFVATNTARLAATTALASKLNKIVVVGRSPNYFLYKETLTKWIEFSGLEVIFPENREFATALGTLEG